VLRGSVMAEVTPGMAMAHIIQRFLKNISSWACTTKIFIILHRCLQDTGGLANSMAKELKSKEHLLHSF
jgi:ANTH domain